MIRRLLILSCMLAACGSTNSTSDRPTNEPKTATEILRKHLTEEQALVKRYCACDNDKCRDAAGAELGATNASLLRALSELEPEDHPTRDDEVAEMLSGVYERIRECKIPFSVWRGDVPKEVRLGASRAMAHYTDPMSHKTVPEAKQSEAGECASALPLSDPTCAATAGRETPTHCFASKQEACSCACGEPSTEDDCGFMEAMSASDEKVLPSAVCTK